ncbi:MAG: hypothetical protein M1821_005819 [Bathelium mastoideum]|nr:MAG: hypothetical protein M1821_005819 [Bathelium mastoideum]
MAILNPLVLLIVAVFIPFAVIGRSVIAYLQNPKGFNKHPVQNWLSAFTKLGYCWELGRRHPVIHSRRLWQDHSGNKKKIIRLGPNWISFGRARAARDIYGYTSQATKGAVYDQLSGGGGAHLANISDKNLHKVRRSMVSHVYAPKHQQHWEESWVIDTCADFMKAIDKHCTKPGSMDEDPDPEDLTMDLVHWGYTYACEVMVKIGMSKDLHLLDNGNNNIEIEGEDGTKREVSIVQSLHCAGRAAANVIWDTKRFTTWVKLMRKVSSQYDRWAAGGGDWHAAMTKLVTERMERHNAGKELNDLFNPWMETKTGEEPDISTRDRIAEIEQMVGAAIDAPGGQVACSIYHLVKDPRTFKKLREELDQVLPAGKSVATWQAIKESPYLKACIDEALRLHPPVATDLIRRVPKEGMVVDG